MAWVRILPGSGEEAPGNARQHAMRAMRLYDRTALAGAPEPSSSDAVFA